jgi:hypothetical protein
MYGPCGLHDVPTLAPPAARPRLDLTMMDAVAVAAAEGCFGGEANEPAGTRRTNQLAQVSSSGCFGGEANEPRWRRSARPLVLQPRWLLVKSS